MKRKKFRYINSLLKDIRKTPSTYGLLALGLGLLVSVGVIIWVLSLEVPALDNFTDRQIDESTKIYDRTGEVVLYDIHEQFQRTSIPLEAISRHIKNATIAIEDTEFYEHAGIKPKAILRAVIANLIPGGVTQGGSTITQQVIKNALLTKDRTVTRKIKEWILAIKLEKMLTKDQILEAYLNDAPYGGNIYGVEEASQTFFGKKASDVTLAEAAYLAALPQAPTFYSPYGENKQELDTRKNLVLQKMLDAGFISTQEYQTAHDDTVVFQPKTDNSIRAPHFSLMIRDYLEKTYGKDVVETGGLHVITTLDYDLQQKAEEIVKRNALTNEEKFNAENAGLVAIDPLTGQILVMVGSRDYFDTSIDGNVNVTKSLRQPGSSFKPFVYATAFKKGYTPQTVVFDLPTQFSTNCSPEDTSNMSPCYSPQNYDGVFRGPITFKDALAQSVNIPAVKALYLSGIKDALQTAQDAGISTLGDYRRYGLTLVLGGGEVTLLEMTNGYSAFANNGIVHPTVSILRIEDRSGKVLESFVDAPRQIFDPQIAYEISDILSDNIARAPAFGDHSALYFPNTPVAVKTGTTNDYRDAWIIGYTPTLVAGAWAGNNDNTPMEKRVAGFIVAPLWHEFMEYAISKIPSSGFPPAPPIDPSLKPVLRGIWEGGQTVLVDKISGGKVTDKTPTETTEERVATNVHSILHWVDTTDPTGPVPISPQKDPQYSRWEAPVRVWAQQHGFIEKTLSDITPSFSDTVHTGRGPRFSIAGIKKTYSTNDTLQLQITPLSGPPLVSVDVLVNGIILHKKTSLRFLLVPLENIPELKSENILTIFGYDSLFNKSVEVVSFSVSE